MTLDKRLVLSFVCGLALLLTSCGDSSSGPSYGDWTLKDSLQLTENLHVSETENFFFGSATTLDVTSDGRIVVADRQANNLKVLRPDGTLLDTLGGPGEGPGEFQQVMQIQVARGDSLYAYDFRQSRLTVFEPEAPYSVTRIVNVTREKGFVSKLLVLENQLVGQFGSGFGRPEEGIQSPDPNTWRVIGDDGSPGDSLFQTQRGRFAFSKAGDRFRIRPIPFQRKEGVTNGPDSRLYHGRTDSLHIQARTADGRSEVVASVPTDPVPVTEAARDSALSDVSDQVRAMVASALPDTKPAFASFLVADDERLWVKRPSEHPDSETVPWWVLDPDAKTIRTVRLPAAVELHVVKDGQVYGTTTTEMGAPAVVRYRIES